MNQSINPKQCLHHEAKDNIPKNNLETNSS